MIPSLSIVYFYWNIDSMLVAINSRYIAKRIKLYRYGSLRWKKTPLHMIISMQLTMMNVNPMRNIGVNVTGDIDDLSLSYWRYKKPSPVPTSKLKDGPAKHPVVACHFLGVQSYENIDSACTKVELHSLSISKGMNNGVHLPYLACLSLPLLNLQTDHPYYCPKPELSCLEWWMGSC